MTPATITVNFLGNYAGPHRICWRVQGSGNPYICTNIVTCAGGGNTCQAIIDVMVDTESCTDTIFEGYIQATCQPEGSTIDRVPFTVTYTPTPSCKAYTLSNTTGDVYDFTSEELGLNCDGTARPTILLANNTSINLCGIAGIPQNIIDNFNVVENNLMCCSICRTYVIKSTTTSPEEFYYTNCSNKNFMVGIAPGSGDPPLEICAVENSITSNSSLSITSGDYC